jgi:long-chain acyl-CoA synthetase
VAPEDEAAKPGKKQAGKKAGKRASKKTAAKKVAKKAGKRPAAKKAARKAPQKRAGEKPAAKKAARKAPQKRAAKDATKQQPAASEATLPAPDAVERHWLAAYPPGVPTTYEYPLVPLTRLLDDAAQDFPHATAIEFLGLRLTYRELVDQVDRFATALRNLGVGKGDRVSIILPNCPQHVIAIFAILRLGAVGAEHDPVHGEEELSLQLNDVGSTVVVCLDPVYPRLARLKGRLPTVRHIVATGLQDYLPLVKARLFAVKHRKDPAAYYRIPESEGVKRFRDLVDRTGPTVLQAEVDPAEDLAVLLHTGGTTGPSKAVMLTHFNLVANSFQARLWMPDIQAGRESVLCVMPFFHSYGLTVGLMMGVLAAATLVLLPRFDPGAVLKAIDRRKPTLFPGVPTIYEALAGMPGLRKFDLSSLRACISGAAPLPLDVARTLEQVTGGKLREGYGLTETSPLTHANPIYGKAKPGSIGLPVTDTVCILVDTTDPSRPAAPGSPGELAVHGPQVMRGYWNRPDETVKVLRDGWLLTGDVAAVDDDGYFSIVERKKG